MAQHPSLTQERQREIMTNRVPNCSRVMAESHLNDLAEELMSINIMTTTGKNSEGVWEGEVDTARIFNHGEVPQFVTHGVDGGASGLVFAGRGDGYNNMITENRECITIHPMVSCSGEKVICHVIFSEKRMTNEMAAKTSLEQITNLLISTTKNGVQDHKSLLEFYKCFDAKLTEQSVQRPVVVLTDDHDSRFDSSVLQFCREKEIRLFVGPPDTTGVTQLLDQVNHGLHHHYRSTEARLCIDSMTIDLSCFMKTLEDIWSTWTTTESLVDASRLVGIAPVGLNVNWMQQDKFAQAQS